MSASTACYYSMDYFPQTFHGGYIVEIIDRVLLDFSTPRAESRVT